MKVLALIPARGGSKRLPGKNIRDFGGRPLIAWSVEVVHGIPDICEVLVSTDDAAIAEVAVAAGAWVPWFRPSELATDSASSVDVALHALDWYETLRGPVDALLLLQPTSPLRTRSTVQRGLELFNTSARSAVVAVSPVQSHPYWCFRIEDGQLQPFVAGVEVLRRSQDLPPAFALNGALYIIAPSTLRTMRSFVPDGTRALLIDNPYEAIDIDTELDWRLAELALEMILK